MTPRFQAAVVLATWLLAGAARAQSEGDSPPVPLGAAAPEPAAAAPDPRREGAEQHRLRALRFYDARNFSAAREEFQIAYELVPSHRLLYNLGVVSMALGDSASAYVYFERCLRDGDEALPAERRAEIEDQLRDLVSHVGTLTIRVDVPGAALSVDGRELGTAPLPRPLHLNAGTHEVVAHSRGRFSRRKIVVAGGQNTVLEFEFSQPRPKPKPHQHDAPRNRWLWVGWTTTGVLTASAVFSGLKALDAQNDYEAELEQLDASRPELDRLDARAGTWALATDVLGAAALVSGGVSLYFTLTGAGGRPEETPSNATRADRFDFAITPRGARAGWAF